MDKKYQVFLSSTFRDLVDERQDALRTILDLGHIPAGMELFPASDVQQLTYIKKIIAECDYYVLIVGGRYGSISESGISYTEQEYDFAVDSGKTVLAFIHGEPGSISMGKSEVDEATRRLLDAFRQKISTGRLVQYWTTRENLDVRVTKSLARAFTDDPKAGWIRGDTAAGSDILAQINQLRNENDALKLLNAHLVAESQPSLNGLAQLDDEVSIRYEYSDPVRGKGVTSRAGITITWKDVLVAVGPSLMHPQTPHVLTESFNIWLVQNTHVRSSAKIILTDANKIKIHLMALNFITSRKAASVASKGIMEFIELTALGKKILLESMAEKR